MIILEINNLINLNKLNQSIRRFLNGEWSCFRWYTKRKCCMLSQLVTNLVIKRSHHIQFKAWLSVGCSPRGLSSPRGRTCGRWRTCWGRGASASWWWSVWGSVWISTTIRLIENELNPRTDAVVSEDQSQPLRGTETCQEGVFEWY